MSNMTDLWLSGVFFQALNTLKLVFGRGSGGAYDAPPDLHGTLPPEVTSSTTLSSFKSKLKTYLFSLSLPDL